MVRRFPLRVKTIALDPSWSEAANICFLNPVDNRPYKSKIIAQPSGGRRAPANCGWVVYFLQFLACRLLSLAVGDYLDDVFCSESSLLARSGFWAFGRLCARTRFRRLGPQGPNTFEENALIGRRCNFAGSSNPNKYNRLAISGNYEAKS